MPLVASRERSAARFLRALAIEFLWAVAAGALALTVVTYLARSEGRGELMFLDGDSMIVPLFSRSILEGAAHNWAMSAVLFVPEILMFLALSVAGLAIQEAQFFAAVLNFVGLYLVFRVAAVTIATGNRAALAATAGFAVVCVFALTESGGDRDGPQLASLLVMTTYYAATVLGAVLTVGLTHRILTHASPSRGLTALLVLIATLSVFSNPLYLAWVTAPLVIVVLVVCAGAAWGRAPVGAITALLGGSALGYLLRIPLAPWIVADPDNYFQPTRSRGSFSYYLSLFIERLSSPAGVFAVAIVLALIVLGAWLTVRSLRRGAVASAVVAAYSWFAPVSTTVGFILLGTEAARYLQLWAFAPALALVVLVTDAAPPNVVAARWRNRVALAAIPAVLGASVIVVLLPQATERATTADASLTCAAHWVNESDAVGAGQFWSIRAIKTHVADPSQLIQVDFALRDYAWLVDRADFTQRAVSFLIVDDHSVPFTLPAGAENLSSTTIYCGRFQILDYSPAEITRP
jgi:hypothetical protein